MTSTAYTIPPSGCRIVTRYIVGDADLRNFAPGSVILDITRTNARPVEYRLIIAIPYPDEQKG